MSDNHTQHPAPARRTLVVKNELGLHARPAARLAQLAQSFRSEVRLEYEGISADAKSILDILSLAAGRGASLTLHCHGHDDAPQAAASIEDFFAQLGA